MAIVLAAGCDWITCTAKTPAIVEVFREIGWQIVYGEAEAGNDLRPWAWKGYDGISSGGASVGLRSDGALIRLSGGCAAEHWRSPARLSEHVSRLDLAVTVRLDPDANPAREAYFSPPVSGERNRGRQVQNAKHIETWKEGETTYLGSRQSARFGRIYNKGLESHKEEYRDCWRWEVEFKGDSATPTTGALAQSATEAEGVEAYVWDCFSKWGHPPVWGAGATVPPSSGRMDSSDDERRMAWLENQVAPAVARLIAHGRLSEVLAALGLDNLSGGQ